MNAIVAQARADTVAAEIGTPSRGWHSLWIIEVTMRGCDEARQRLGKSFVEQSTQGKDGEISADGSARCTAPGGRRIGSRPRILNRRELSLNNDSPKPPT
jgi:hypothetical protein